MALDATIGGDGSLFVGEDKVFKLEVIDINSAPVNITGWVLRFDVRKLDASPAPPILSFTPTISGTFNASRVINTQRAIVTVTSTDMDKFKAGTFRHSWKRMDSGSETVLAWGNFIPQKATAP